MRGLCLPVSASSLFCLLAGGALLFSRPALAVEEQQDEGIPVGGAQAIQSLGEGIRLPDFGKPEDDHGIILAQAQVEPETPARPADSVTPAASRASASPAERAAGGLGNASGVKPPSRWGIAPIRWGMTVSDSLRWSKLDEGVTSTQHLQQIQDRCQQEGRLEAFDWSGLVRELEQSYATVEEHMNHAGKAVTRQNDEIVFF